MGHEKGIHDKYNRKTFKVYHLKEVGTVLHNIEKKKFRQRSFKFRRDLDRNRYVLEKDLKKFKKN